MRRWLNKDMNREFLKASWDVKKLCVAGRWREAVLLHHAQKSGMEAGYAMDYFIERRGGIRRINMKLAERALSAMNKYERVSRLMYRAGLLEYQGLCRILDVNEQNRRELEENISPEMMELFAV